MCDEGVGGYIETDRPRDRQRQTGTETNTAK